jgi:choline dehydrogenase-like flavoprotein
VTDKDETDALVGRRWDYVIIGTGIGGSTIGHALAKAGFAVLFCERGLSHLDAPDSHKGDWLEALPAMAATGATKDDKARAGRFTEHVTDITRRRHRTESPYIGIGTGGSSALYGMVMERFFESDFSPRSTYPQASDANLPEAWPFSYQEILPYYEKAETLYGVRATADPLRPTGEASGARAAPPFSEASACLVEGMRAEGLHPYHVPLTCESVPGCLECVGFLCPKNCKRDAATVCLSPAVRDHGAGLLTECEVDRIVERDGRATGVEARLKGRPVFIEGRTIILAAGAVHTPAILLRSGGANGLANGSDQVGRNLMRHFIDYYLLYPSSSPKGGLVKQIALNDFYQVGDQKLGTVQSNGHLPPVPMLVAGLRETLGRIWAPLKHLYPLVRPFAIARATSLSTGAYPMVSFCEDLPYRDNCIALAADRKTITMRYRISDHDRDRLAQFRRLIARRFRAFRPHPIHQAHLNNLLGHVCGTCRSGDDPATCVLDRNNRAHEVENLYVVDSSFFPTSAGTNPSLTIAANALRVADVLIADAHKQKEHAGAQD